MKGNRERSIKGSKSQIGSAQFYSHQIIFSTLVVLILFIFGIASNTQAQSFAIDWWTVGGSVPSTGGEFSLDGTTGRHDGGTMSGGIYSIDGGFWAISAPYYLYLPLIMK